MANAPGYLADYLNGLMGGEQQETFGALLKARPQSRKVAIWGDSISAQNTGVTGSPAAATTKAEGYMAQAHALCMGRFDWDETLNFGVNGDNSSAALARLPAVLASGASVVVIEIGTNDGPQGLTVAQSMTNIAAMFAGLLNAGIRVIVIPILPRSYAGDTPALRQQWWDTNHRIKKLVRSYNTANLQIAGCDLAILDPASSIGGAIAGPPSTQSDGLHPVAFGAALMAVPLAVILTSMFPATSPDIISQADVFDAALNPFGALNINNSLSGTSGTAGTGATGNVATGKTISRSSGSTVTATVSKDTDGAQLIVLGGGSGGNSNEVIRMIDAANFNTSVLPAGTKVVVEADVEAVNLVNVRGVYAICQPSGSTGTVGLNPTAIATDREVANWRKRIITPPITISTPGAVTLASFLQIMCDATGSGVSGQLKIRQLLMRPLS